MILFTRKPDREKPGHSTTVQSLIIWLLTLYATCTSGMITMPLAEENGIAAAGSPRLTVISPNGSESWPSCSRQTIRWVSENLASSDLLNLYVSYDNGGNWQGIWTGVPNTGSLEWDVPTMPTNKDCWIMVRTVSTPAVFDTSDEPFTIEGPAVELISPAGGEHYWPGAPCTVFWRTDNMPGSRILYIQLSVDQGTTWQTLGNASAISGTLECTIPKNSAAGAGLIKISEAGSGAQDIIDEPVIIEQAAITDISPAGGESWQMGMSCPITWNSVNMSHQETVFVYYSTDGGNTWLSIDGSKNTGYYNWTVPTMATSTRSRIKICWYGQGGVEGISADDFSLIGPQFTILFPNGGEKFTACSTQPVRWDYSPKLPYLYSYLEYSTDGGSNWFYASSAYSGHSSSWRVPAGAGSRHCRIRLNGPYGGDMNDADFEIEKATLQLTSPVGGEQWESGSVQQIMWNSSGLSPDTKFTLSYSTDGGGTWRSIGGDIPNTGLYSWKVPRVISDHCRIKLEIEQSEPFETVTPADFSISYRIGSLNLSAPLSGTAMIAGNRLRIAWSYLDMDPADLVILSIRRNGTSTYSRIAWLPVAAGEYNWLVPADLVPGEYTFRIQAYQDIQDELSYYLNFRKPAITLLQPNGGKVWETGSNNTVLWASTNLGSSAGINIQYSLSEDAGWHDMVLKTANTGSYGWRIPVLPSSTSFQVRISIDGVPDEYDVSDRVNTLAGSSLTLISPNGGENWQPGTVKRITWSSSRVPSADQLLLSYTNDQGLNWNPVGDGAVPNSGSYAWMVPLCSDSNQCRVRIENSGEVPVRDESNNNFRIAGTFLEITSPAGGEQWPSTSFQTVRWNSRNIPPGDTVRIEYLNETNGSSYWSRLTECLNSGVCQVEVPCVSSTSRVSLQLSHQSGCSFRSNSVVILPSGLSITSPGPSAEWIAGTMQTVSWTSRDLRPDLYLSVLYRKTGETYWRTWMESVPNSGTAVAVFPACDSVSYQLKLCYRKNGTELVSTESEPFAVTGSRIQVTSPNGGEVFPSGSLQTITWIPQNMPASGKVKIDLLGDTLPGSNILASSAPNTGSFQWTVPVVGRNSRVQVRVTSMEVGTVYDISDGFFEIAKPGLTLETPLGGESFATGSIQRILWSSTGLDPSSALTLSYSLNAGLNWVKIQTVGNTGFYDWKIPPIHGSAQCRVRIATDGNRAVAVNPNWFTIQNGTIAITRPSGGETFASGDTVLVEWETPGYDEPVPVYLYFSSNGGISWWDPLVYPLDGNQCKAVIPSGIVSDRCLFKITTKHDSRFYHVMDRYFQVVKPELTLLSPNGGELLPAGSRREITWDTNLDPRNRLNIYYASEFPGNQPQWILVESDVPNTGNYSWLIPGVPVPSAGSVRVEWAAKPDLVWDTADRTFNFVESSLVLSSPAEGTVIAGTGCRISWSAGGLPAGTEMLLSYSTDGGLDWLPLAGNMPCPGEYHWNVPLTEGSRFRLKVSAENDENYSVESGMDCHIISGWGRLHPRFMQAAASNEDSGFPASAVLDGRAGTAWKTEQPLPQAIAIQLASPKKIQQLLYLPPQDGSGGITGYRILVSDDDLDYHELACGVWNESQEWQEAVFDEVSTRYLQLEVTAGSSAVAELDLYGANPPEGDINQDEVVDAKDLIQLADYLSGIPLPWFCALAECDLSGDGRIGAEDLVLLQQALVAG